MNTQDVHSDVATSAVTRSPVQRDDERGALKGASGNRGQKDRQKKEGRKKNHLYMGKKKR